jgi:hypothetical protein
VIVPDDKDWTWVLDRRCSDCGFDPSGIPASDVPELIRENSARWRQLTASGAIRPGRPDERTWSPLEYACHVRDVYQRYLDRVALMLTEHHPLFPNWDQDATAVDDAYESQEPSRVAEQLSDAAEALASRLSHLAPEQWSRPGRRSDGASFTVDTISRYMIHDPIHHIWDVTADHP